MNAACTLNQSAYNHRRGVRNLIGGTRTRKTCGFFVPPCLASVHGLEGWGILEYPPPFLCGSEPPNRPHRASFELQKLIGGHHGR